MHDQHGNGELQQVAVAEMLASGGYALHLRRFEAALQHQQRNLRDAMLRYFPAGTEVSSPAGGFVLWARLPEIGGGTVSTRPLFKLARAEGIGFAPGHLFGQGGAYDDCLRVNAGYRWTNELETAQQSSVSARWQRLNPQSLWMGAIRTTDLDASRRSPNSESSSAWTRAAIAAAVRPRRCAASAKEPCSATATKLCR